MFFDLIRVTGFEDSSGICKDNGEIATPAFGWLAMTKVR